jgi:ribonuclease HI
LIVVFADGACEPVNPGGIGTFGYVICEDGRCLEEGSGVVGEGATNNVAEYTAVIQALRKLLQMGVSGSVRVKSDSQLLINQLRGVYRVRAGRILPLHRQVLHLLRELERRGVAVEFSTCERETPHPLGVG